MAKAELNRVPLAEALRDLHVRRASGDLVVKRGHHRKKLRFIAGDVVQVESDLLEDTLGRAVVKWGLLRDAEVRAMEEIGGAEGLRDALIQNGVLDEQGLAEFIEQLQLEWALGLFLWKDGEIEFLKGDPPPGGSGHPILSVPNLILEGVRRSTGFDPIRERLLWANPVLKFSDAPAVSLDELKLHPQEGYLFSLVDGSADLKQTLTLSHLGDEETLRLVYVFLVLGILVAPHIGIKDGEQAPLFSIRRFGEQEERFAERIEDAVFKIRSINESLSDLDDWQVLGLERGAAPDEVNKVYQQLIQRYRPDRFPLEVQRKCRRELEMINARIGAAYLSLTEREIGQITLAGARGASAQHQRLRTREQIEAEQAEAESEAREFLKRAKEAESNHDFHTAIQFVEQAIRRDPENPGHHAYHAHLLQKNPRWAKRAEAALSHAIDLDPDNADFHWDLAQLYLRSNVRTKARQAMQKVSELDPSRAEEVKAALRKIR